MRAFAPLGAPRAVARFGALRGVARVGAPPVALVVLLAACGASKAASVAPSAPTTVTLPTTATTPSTVAATTTTVAPLPLDPLTGLPEPTPAAVSRTAVVVKIDNVDAARPQTGVNQADVVYEEMVEGGLSRLAAVFQSQLPDPVGPVRSGRSTDIGIIDDLNHPVFVYSGANPDFLDELADQPVTNVNADNHPSEFFRGGTHPAPHNFFANTTALVALASSASGPPPALFSYRSAGQAPNTGATPATGVSLSFPAASAAWAWDAGTGMWDRRQNGTPDVDTAGAQVVPANVVIQSLPYVTALVEAGGTVIPEGRFEGTGKAWVLTDGSLVEGTWTRSSLSAVTTWSDPAGNPILLTPGRTWVELLPVGRVPTFTP